MMHVYRHLAYSVKAVNICAIAIEVQTIQQKQRDDA
jgi:hypothetical protein